MQPPLGKGALDAESHEIAHSLMQAAARGLTGQSLFEAVRSDHPEATNRTIMRAAFFAVTRPEIDGQTAMRVYELGLLLRRRGSRHIDVTW